MTETDHWLTEYGQSHRDISNPALYWPSSLLLVFGVVGVFWSLPIPAEFAAISPILNWGSTFLLAAVVYYFVISIALAIGMLPFILGVTALQMWLVNSPWPGHWVSVGLTVAALMGLFVGQFPRGSLRQLLNDTQLLMIGPVWMLSRLYKRLGIPF